MSKSVIKSVDTWIEINGMESTSIAQVTYSNGNVKRWYLDASRDWPKSVYDFITSHSEAQFNSQVTHYE